jgi:hypothetical protein
MNNLKNMDHALLITLALDTGMRSGEILCSHLEPVPENVISISKIISEIILDYEG